MQRGMGNRRKRGMENGRQKGRKAWRLGGVQGGRDNRRYAEREGD